MHNPLSYGIIHESARGRKVSGVFVFAPHFKDDAAIIIAAMQMIQFLEDEDRHGQHHGSDDNQNGIHVDFAHSAGEA
jgi:hypothetical protein